jgi:hypothetical protein
MANGANTKAWHPWHCCPSCEGLKLGIVTEATAAAFDPLDHRLPPEYANFIALKSTASVAPTQQGFSSRGVVGARRKAASRRQLEEVHANHDAHAEDLWGEVQLFFCKGDICHRVTALD